MKPQKSVNNTEFPKRYLKCSFVHHIDCGLVFQSIIELSLFYVMFTSFAQKYDNFFNLIKT